MSASPTSIEADAGSVVPVKRAAVIGAGNMGAGIAALFANAGIPVVLLDIPSKDGARNGAALKGFERQIRTGGFTPADHMDLVSVGNTEDDLSLLADADWIVEAVVENLAIKRDLFERIDKVRKPGSAVSSNTSTIRRAEIVAGLPKQFDESFLITHFFNPPRHMRLLELVWSAETRPEIVAMVSEVAGRSLGKTLVVAHDTPGFVANRIGCYWMAIAAVEAIRIGLDPDEADAAIAQTFNTPPTGVFGLFDLVGIDLVKHAWTSLEKNLLGDDEINAVRLSENPVFGELIARGQIGRKAKAGFYRQSADGSRECLNFETMTYRPEAVAGGGANDFCWSALSRLITYAAIVGPEIAGDVVAIDTAMKLGYAWEYGPFELADRIGASHIRERLAIEKRPIPHLLQAAAEAGGFYQQGVPMPFPAPELRAAARHS